MKGLIKIKTIILCVCFIIILILGYYTIWYSWSQAKSCENIGNTYVQIWSTDPWKNRWECVKFK